MRKILSIIKREYFLIVRTKGFIISTILGPVFMAAIIGIPILASLVSVAEQEKIGVIDSTKEIFGELDNKLGYKMKDGRRRYLLEKYELTTELEELRDSLRQKVLDKELSAYIFIPEDIVNPQPVLELGDGTKIKLSSIWMINFINSKWFFPQERYKIVTSQNYFFLKDGSIISGKIIDFSSNQRFFKLKNGEKIVVDSIKRIYFSKNFPNILQKQIEGEVLKSGEAAFFIQNGDRVIGEIVDISRGGDAEYVSKHVSDFDEIKSINQAINSVVIEKRLREEGLDPQKITQYIRLVGLKTIKVTKKGEEEDTMGTFLISYLLVIMLYITLFFYGAMIMRGVLEEKTSRVVEVVLSSVRPFQLMIGKIFGIAAVGFTQYAIWALFGFAASRYSKTLISSFLPAAAGGFKLASVPAYIFIYFVVFFILGYFLYATFYATIGSMVNSEKEAQQLLMPVTMFLVVPMLMMAFILRNPNSSLAVTLSLIPFFAPILMLMRICILLPPFIEIASSIVLLVLTIFVMIWFTSKIYRVGILMYGKRPNFKEIVKWMRYK